MWLVEAGLALAVRDQAAVNSSGNVFQVQAHVDAGRSAPSAT